jgi:hypothetical protein
METTHESNTEFDCNVVASLLDSATLLANAGNTGALIAGIGCLFGDHPGFYLLAFGASLLLWGAQTWFAVRTNICASLFRDLAENPVAGRARMDDLLVGWGLIPQSTRRERTVADRSLGALWLLRNQRILLRIQLVTVAVGLLLKYLNI